MDVRPRHSSASSYHGGGFRTSIWRDITVSEPRRNLNLPARVSALDRAYEHAADWRKVHIFVLGLIGTGMLLYGFLSPYWFVLSERKYTAAADLRVLGTTQVLQSPGEPHSGAKPEIVQSERSRLR